MLRQFEFEQLEQSEEKYRARKVSYLPKKEKEIKYYFKTVRREDGKLSIRRVNMATGEVVCDLHVEDEWFVTLALDLLQRNPAELWGCAPKEAKEDNPVLVCFVKPIYCV